MNRPEPVALDLPQDRGRAFAAVIAGVAWLGLALLLVESIARLNGSVLGGVWRNLGFFTDLANLLVAVVFTGVALGRPVPRRPRVLGWALVSILLVGGMYWGVLGGATVFGKVGLGDMLVHGATPVLVPVYWLLYAPHRRLRYSDAALWAIFPLAYFGYAQLRGLATGTYPYRFMNPGTSGYINVLAFALGVAIAFWALGLLAILLDRKWPLDVADVVQANRG